MVANIEVLTYQKMRGKACLVSAKIKNLKGQGYEEIDRGIEKDNKPLLEVCWTKTITILPLD